MASLTVRGLERRFEDEAVALSGVSFHVPGGRVTALFGPSGCGKTTVLRLIAGLDRPDGGEVLIGGHDVLRIPAHRRDVGLMFQELALFPHLDVRRNIEFGLRMSKWPKRAREARVMQLLQLVGLPGLGQRRMHELSGGERQRVALARVLAPEPKLLLLDEPLGALDEPRKEELRAQLGELLRRLDTTAVVVSHDLRDAIALADDLVVMADGAVLQAGPLSLVLAAPASVAVARLLGWVTLAQGPVEHGRIVEPSVGAIAVPPGTDAGGQAQVLAHPASLLAVPGGMGLGSGVEGTVLRSSPEGPAHVLEIALGGRTVSRVRWEWDLAPPPVGSAVAIAARPGTLRFFRTIDDWEPVGHGAPAPVGGVEAAEDVAVVEDAEPQAGGVRGPGVA
ncbi:MAG: ABC transporter ATP-binding protein [Dehalococcoidia bacterium]|nr:ABC transporter ATP-binding protein [Dehalococcoidia bacterium]